MSKTMKRILVIEDNVQHTADAQIFFGDRFDVNVFYAQNYQDAEKIMFDYDKETCKKIKGNIDGVISDIYFPLTSQQKWNQEEPIGVRVAVELSQLGIPFVLNTAGYHHGRKYEWINQFARQQEWKVIDAGREHEQDSESKDWQKAYQSLEDKMNGIDTE